MFSHLLLYIGAALTAIWGIAHLFPTNSVVKGFGGITEENKRIITMEWILEGVSLLFIGVLVASATAINASSVVSKTVYALSATSLVCFAVVSLFTGFKVSFLPFKLCPFIFSISAILILLGGFAL